MASNQITPYYLDGKLLESLDVGLGFGNSGFLFGQSTFTTAAIINHGMTFFNAHLERLSTGWLWLFGEDIEKYELTEILKNHIKESYANLKKATDQADWRLRVTLFKDENGQQRTLCIFKEIDFSAESFCGPIREMKTHKGLNLRESKKTGVKLPDYSEAFSHQKKATGELLFVDDQGIVGEAATANVVFYCPKRNSYVCPQNEKGILQGIGLRIGLKDQKLEREELRESDLSNFSGMWQVNSLRGVRPVLMLNEQELADSLEMTKHLKKAFDEKGEETKELL